MSETLGKGEIITLLVQKMSRSIISPFLLFAITSLAWSSGAEINYRKVVDTEDELPIVPGPWAGFYNPAISDGKVAFLAYRPAFSPLSLFAEFNGEIVHVASNGDAIPADGRTISQGFTTVSFPLYHGGRIYWEVALRNGTEFSLGVVEYSNAGLRLAFDEASVNVHAGTSLSWFSYHDLKVGSDNRVVRALSGPGNVTGSYLWLIGFDGTKLSTVNAETSLPPTTTRFTQNYATYGEGFATYHPNENPKFRRDHLGVLQTLDAGLAQLVSPDVLWVTDEVFGNGRWFAIQGRLKNPNTSIFTNAILGWAAGEWFEIIRVGGSAQDGTVITGLSDISAPRYSLDGNSLLFTAGTANGDSLFLFRNGEVRRLLSPGDSIDGHEVASVLIGPNSLEGDNFSFVTQFTDSIRAVYVGDLSVLYPPPTTSLKSEITLTGQHTGTVAVPTKENRVYHLIQSDDLLQSKVIRSVQGGEPLQIFTFDNSLEAPKRMFYWVEEVPYDP